MRDMYNNIVEVGDQIAYATQNKRAHLRVGVVVNMTKKRATIQEVNGNKICVNKVAARTLKL